MSATHVIAVVDDDPSILRALRRLLHLAGFSVKTFGSGEELLGCEELATIGCLVLDVNLTGLSGFQVQERLGDLKLSIPIVFITAHDDATTRARAERAGDARYLRKPFDERALIGEIQKALAGA
jgi:FixJ family two-component response regulator